VNEVWFEDRSSIKNISNILDFLYKKPLNKDERKRICVVNFFLEDS